MKGTARAIRDHFLPIIGKVTAESEDDWWSGLSRARPAIQGTRAAPSMKILTVQFSSVEESEISSGSERRAVEGQAMTLPREKAPNVAEHHFYLSELVMVLKTCLPE